MYYCKYKIVHVHVYTRVWLNNVTILDFNLDIIPVVTGDVQDIHVCTWSKRSRYGTCIFHDSKIAIQCQKTELRTDACFEATGLVSTSHDPKTFNSNRALRIACDVTSCHVIPRSRRHESTWAYEPILFYRTIELSKKKYVYLKLAGIQITHVYESKQTHRLTRELIK